MPTKKPVILSTSKIETPPDRMIAFDPGLTTGVCVFEKGRIVDYDQYNLEELSVWLEPQEANICVMELYRLFKWLALQQSGSEMEVAQAEGIILSWATRKGIKKYDQSPQVLPIAQKWASIDIEKGGHKNSHWKSAYVHGIYWLVSNNMIEVH